MKELHRKFILGSSKGKTTMVDSKMTTCPFCNHRFDGTVENCHPHCFMSNGCPLIRCPNCGYEYVAESKTINFFKKVLRRTKGER